MKNHVKAAIAVALYVCAFALFIPKGVEAGHGRRHHGMRMTRRGNGMHSEWHKKRMALRMERYERMKKRFGTIEDLKNRIAKLEELNKEDLEKASEQVEKEANETEEGSIEELQEDN